MFNFCSYFRHKKLSNSEEKVYHDFDKFREYYGFELRDADPTRGSIEYNLKSLKLFIKLLCKQPDITNIYNESLIFNRFKLYASDLVEVAADLPTQLFIPIVDRYFPDIKEYFYKQLLENGINNTYDEVKNKIVNHLDMRFIIDPMNVAIKKTLKYVSVKYLHCQKSLLKSNKTFNKFADKIVDISSHTWFGDKTDGEYEISLADFFITYEKCISRYYCNSDRTSFSKLIDKGIESSLIIYFWYLTCYYFANSSDKKISYIRTDIEMFYMRSLHAISYNYSCLLKLRDERTKYDTSKISSVVSYYSNFVDFAKIYTSDKGTDFINKVKELVLFKEKYDDCVIAICNDSSDEEQYKKYTSVISNLNNTIDEITEIVKNKKENVLTFDPLDRLIDSIFDTETNSVEMCRPSIYLDLSTPKSEYCDNNDKKEIK